LNLNQSILKVLSEQPEERFSYSADALGISEEDFQVVVEKVMEAKARGYIRTVLKPHKSSRTGLYDTIVAEGLTPEGKAALEDGWS